MKLHNKTLKIAIFGENPSNDAASFRLLLEKRPYPNVQFSVPFQNVRNKDIKNSGKIARIINNIKTVDRFIIIRDLDGLVAEKEKLQQCDEWFNTLNKAIGQKGIFYLTVAQMEALLLSDIPTLNQHYGTTMKYRQAIKIPDPKKVLKENTATSKKQYHENHCRDLMSKINFETVFQKHTGERSFNAFIQTLDELLEAE